MAVISGQRKLWIRRLAWFAALWLSGVMAVGIVGLLIRWSLRG